MYKHNFINDMAQLLFNLLQDYIKENLFFVSQGKSIWC